MLTVLLDALFPSLCAGCRSERCGFCDRCRTRAWAPRSVPVGGICVHAAGRYAGALRRAILAYKGGRRDVGRSLGDFLAVGAPLPGDAVLVPVPTTAGRRAQRGFDQSVLLATAVGAQRGRAVLDVLRQSAGDAQRGRSRAARLNARGRFACAPSDAARIAGRRVVLVDDVVTTGATLADCARTLRACGASVEAAVVLAYA